MELIKLKEKMTAEREKNVRLQLEVSNYQKKIAHQESELDKHRRDDGLQVLYVIYFKLTASQIGIIRVNNIEYDFSFEI